MLTSTPPASGTEIPCPVACTPTGSFSAAAYATASCTSRGDGTAATSAGRCRNAVWKPCSASSNPSSPGSSMTMCPTLPYRARGRDAADRCPTPAPAPAFYRGGMELRRRDVVTAA